MDRDSESPIVRIEAPEPKPSSRPTTPLLLLPPPPPPQGEMATGNSNGYGDRFDPPKTPRVVLKPCAEDELPPDTEENVIQQTDRIFRNFVVSMQALDRGSEGADDTPSCPEITAFSDPPLAQASLVGRRLAEIGDDINERYTPLFNSMIRSLNLAPDVSDTVAYDAFYQVAMKLFKDGQINWGRIVTLLCFGYRLTATVIQRGISGFFSKIVTFILEFLISNKITKWIAQHGGWGAVLCLVPETMGWTNFGLVISLAAVSVITAIYLTKK